MPPQPGRRDLSDRGLSDLIGELVTRSDGFTARWPGTTCGCIAPPANGWATAWSGRLS